MGLAQFWEIIANQCLFLNVVYEVEFQAVVLMPNHFHILMTVPQHDLGVVMNDFMRSVSRRSNLLTGRSGHLFGGAYHWSLVNNTRYFNHALKYIYRNPVRAQLCEKVEDYPYSTLHGLVGGAHLPFPIHAPRIGIDISLPAAESFEQLNWLNTPFPVEAESLIRKGLRKKLFDEILDRKTRKHAEALDGII